MKLRYDTALFDADGTLLDFLKAEKAALSECLRILGLPYDDSIIETYSKINDNCWKKLECGELDKTTLRKQRFDEFCEFYGFRTDTQTLSTLYTDKLAHYCFLIDGAVEISKKLFEYGCRLYIVTNGLKKVQESRFKSSGLNDYFIHSFISEEVGYEKPRKEYFEFVKNKIPDFINKKTLIIGDSLTSDIKGGNNAGIDTCWYNPLNKNLPNGKDDPTITYSINRLSQIENIILYGRI